MKRKHGVTVWVSLLGICGWLGLAALASGAPQPAAAIDAPTWHYYVRVERADRGGKRIEPGKALLWLPPGCETVRGLFVLGRLGIEGELIADPAVRRACAECDLAIVYFDPHISGVFHFWQQGNTDAARWLKALDDLAKRSGHAEIVRAPWITAGHSTAGIFARNVAYWKPERVAAVVHVKSGNFHQQEHLPPNGSLAGIPLVAINGQFESFGPEGGLRPEFGRETQWVFAQKDLQKFRAKDPNCLMSMLVHPGDDHFHGAPELGAYVATWLRATAKHRLPATLPPGSGPVACLKLKAEDGWLTDPGLYAPKHAPAPYADYAGDKAAAMWHYDRETAEATVAFHKNLGRHQALESPACTWLDGGDGWTFRVESKFLDTMPEKFGGRVGGQKIGHSPKPFVCRCAPNEPVVQIGPDTFCLVRPVKNVNVAAFHPGDEQYRPTVRWGSLNVPNLKGQPQTIEFPAVAAPKPGEKTGTGSEPGGGGAKKTASGEAPVPVFSVVDLRAKATSGLPLYYEVEYGPVTVRDGKLRVAELPARPRFPIECRVTAYQMGRRIAPVIQPAPPVSQVFQIVGP